MTRTPVLDPRSSPLAPTKNRSADADSDWRPAEDRMTAPFVETHELTKRYGRVTALDGCSISIGAGEVFGLLGPNGSGKTTLLRTILGFLQPTSGWAKVGGRDCWKDAVAVHRITSYMPGEARLFPHMRGKDALKFFADIHPAGDFSKAMAIADRLALDTSRRVLFCSSGMRQKIALAAVMSPDVQMIVLDEPTSNLDPTARQEVLTMALEAKRQGRTVVFSSHVLSEIEQACDRTCILRYGLLAHTQVMSELRRQHRIVANLKGALPTPPTALAEGLEVHRLGPNKVSIQTPGELSPLLGWLASLPMTEVRIEPIGLQAVYDRIHAGEAA
jgi:ABC-2 type transport system ATP-binding protein